VLVLDTDAVSVLERNSDDATLVTANVADFVQIDGVKVASWK